MAFMLVFAAGLFLLLTLKYKAVWLPSGRVVGQRANPLGYWSFVAVLVVALVAACWLAVVTILSAGPIISL